MAPTPLPCLAAAQDFVALAKWEDRGYYALRCAGGGPWVAVCLRAGWCECCKVCKGV